MKKYSIMRAVMALVVMLACTATSFSALSETVAEAATAKINYSKKTLYVGKTVKLRIKNSKASYKWTSSNAKVAKVAANGTVTAVKKGSATITATSASGKKTYTCKVTVRNPYVLPKDVKVLMPGQTLQLSVKGGTPVKFTSSDSKVAKVDSKTGLVTAVKGSDVYVTIKVKCENGKTYKRNVIVLDLGTDTDEDKAGTTDNNDASKDNNAGSKNPDEGRTTGGNTSGGSTTGGNTSGGSTTGGNTGKSGDTGSGTKKTYLSVPVIPGNCYGLFNPQEKEEWYTDSLYEISDEMEFAEVCKMEMDKCNEDFAIHFLAEDFSYWNDYFVDLCGKYSITANYAGFYYDENDYRNSDKFSITHDNWFLYQYADSPDFDELLADAIDSGMDVFTGNVIILKPYYSYAAQASALLRYEGYPAGSEARRVLNAATAIVEDAIKKSSDLNEVILNVNNKICAMTTYDTVTDSDRTTTVELGSDGKYHVLPGRDATGIIDNGLGVCQAYAALFKLCMDILGVPNEYVCNEADTHIWNRIYVNGTWYHVDVTWNDSLSNAYFMVRDSELAGLDARYSAANPREHAFCSDFLSQ